MPDFAETTREDDKEVNNPVLAQMTKKLKQLVSTGGRKVAAPKFTTPTPLAIHH